MLIHEKPIDWYIEKLKRGEHFSLAGYSDAEFFCMMGIRKNQFSGLGQQLCPEHGKKLTEIMQRRQHDPRWMFAIPKCLWTAVLQFRKNPASPYNIDSWLEKNGISIEVLLYPFL